MQLKKLRAGRKYLARKDIRLRKRKETSHKGENGRVLVVGGSIDYVGAVLLSGMAAFRTGVDTVVVAAPKKVAWAINTFSPDFITKKFSGDYFRKSHAREIVNLSKGFDVVLLGSGIGKRKETGSFVGEIVKNVQAMKVIDADAIGELKLHSVKRSIITPHKGELEALMKRNSISSLSQLRKELDDNVVIIKGKTDIVLSKRRVAYNRTGNAGMTVGGTGDVLAGVTAGILAQNKDLFSAACAAAYINGRAGYLLFREKGYGFIASEMLEKIPLILKKMV